MEDNNDALAWKQKYLDSLDELEAKEQRWTQIEQILRQGLIRLSLAADGSDQELNLLLERLRKLLRSGADEPELKAMLEQLVEPIRRLDERRKEHASLPHPNELLETIIGRMNFPRGMGHRAKALQKRLLQAGNAPHGPLLDEFVGLLSESLNWQGEEGISESPGTEKRGLLGRLLPARDTGATSLPQRELNTALPQELLEIMLVGLEANHDIDLKALERRIHASSQRQEILRLGRELTALLKIGPQQAVVDGEELDSPELMIRLLERLEVPNELEPEAAAIREMLESPDVTEHMEKAIKAIADLVREMRARVMNEKNEIEAFLNQLTDRLREIDEGFQQNVKGQRAAYEGGKQLDAQVHEQVSEIEQSVNDADDLNGLKSRIAKRINTIRSHMQQFRQDQDQRLEQAETQVNELNQRLHSMQQESEQLHQRVKQQRDLAMIDPLTGVPNRLAYNERLALEYARWKRYQHDLVLAIWDVDRFKLINDTYGHQAGDKVLTVIAKLLLKQVRETDFVARYGGEEFLLLMPETNLEGAAKLTEQLRVAVENCEFHFRGKRVPITISCGMSAFQAGDTPEQVFSRADAALYKAKANGRNQCHSG